ncbi:apoptosis regulator BAX [Amia ocellicauda]|uniref:apoptosis regulator BAX n=1 Tax=Amia ocellicauda TaxID=2972642 RepID=UPI0034646D47
MAQSSGAEPEDEMAATGGEDTVDDRIIEQGAIVFRGYVVEAMRTDNPDVHLDSEDLGGRPQEGQDPQIKEIVQHLLVIADELNRNAELEHLIDTVEFDSAQDLFFTVARKIFDDGINWGRIVALFHFGYKLIYKAITCNHSDIIRKIIGWVLQFLRENALRWIRAQGGWEAVQAQFQSLSWHSVAIFVAGVLTGALVCWKVSS